MYKICGGNGVINDINIDKLMIDTAPFIYYIEKHEKYFSVIKPIFQKIDNFEISAITSIISLIEVLVQSKEKSNEELEKQYLNILLENDNLEVISIDENIAKKAADIKVKYDLKIPDAIQIATGIIHECDSFLTNDKQLKKVAELNILILSDLFEI